MSATEIQRMQMNMRRSMGDVPSEPTRRVPHELYIAVALGPWVGVVIAYWLGLLP